MKAAKENSPRLAELLHRLKQDDVDAGTYDEGLRVCARKGFVEAAGLFIDKGATHYVSTFGEAIEHGQYEVASLLLLCACVNKGDIDGLQKLFGDTDPPREGFRSRSSAISALTSIQLSQNSKTSHASVLAIASMQPHRTAISHVLHGGQVRTVHVIKVALRTHQLDAALLVLLNTCCKLEQRKVEWSQLGLKKLAAGWLKAVCEWVARLDLSDNMLTVVCYS